MAELAGDEIVTRWRAILARVRAAERATGRPEGSVTLIAVSKTHPASAVAALWKEGHRDFGENYVQELVAKAQELEAMGCAGIRWHFIGHLQSNKAKQLVVHAGLVHSVDSLRLAQELGKRWNALGRAEPLPVMLEVNLDAEGSKAGLSPSEAPQISASVSAVPGLRLEGLMCIPDPASDTTGAFRRLRELESACRPATRGKLSMGMTRDFEAAIREGATHVRVGTAIFGERG
jgi:pyridoxal phosphate enzyme (YggS family)